MRKFCVLTFFGCIPLEYGIADAFLSQRNTLIRDYRRSVFSKSRLQASTIEPETTDASSQLESIILNGKVRGGSNNGDNNEKNGAFVEVDGTEPSTTNKANNPHWLDLDSKGRLLIDGQDVILDGITPSKWSVTRPSNTEGSDSPSSLFLNTYHSTESDQHETELGQLVTCNRLLACSRVTRYWMGPAFGSCAKDVPIDTQFLLVELSEDGPYALLLPLVDGGFRASLHYGGNNINLVCHSESGDVSVTSSGMRALFVSVGDDPFKLLKAGFAAVAEEVGTFATLDQKTLPPSVDEFGWCTWDAFYSKVTPQGVIEGVNALREAGVPPRTLILDDGWQEVSPSPPDWLDVKETKPKKSGIILYVTSLVFDALSKVVQNFYNSYVAKAQHGSIPNKIWSYLTRTILKSQLWNYFDTETDFGRQLSGFDPNHKFQPGVKGYDGGLKGLVSVLKNELDVNRVYCWHALHGYWRGVSPELGKSLGVNVTDVYPKPSNHLLSIEPQLEWDTVSLFGVGLLTNPLDLAVFYANLHAPLVEAGVDGVKVDVQSGVSAVGGGVGGGPHLARIYTEAMENSVSQHFTSEDGAANCINCMCHSTENLYRHKVTSIARASDDFYPRRPESHTVHIVNVAYNSLFMGEICLPDWDMFHSKHESAELHAAARAIGGCPVYVSDAPGNHDPVLLRRLVLPDGSVLRAKQPGRPTRDCLFVDVGRDQSTPLKIWNQNSFGGVVGAFHVQGVAWNFDTHENEVLGTSFPDLIATVKPHDVESLRDINGPFVGFRHKTSSIEIIPSGDFPMNAQIAHRGWEIFTIVPMQVTDDGISWAPIGLADMLNTGGAILQAGNIEQPQPNSEGSTPRRAQVESRGPGRFIAYAKPAPDRILVQVNDSPLNLPFSYDEISGEVCFVLPEENKQGDSHRIVVEWD